MNNQGKKIAILVEDQCPDMDLWYPYFRLMEEGFEPVLVALGEDGNGEEKQGYPETEMLRIEELAVEDVHGVIIPETCSPDRVWLNEKMLVFLRDCTDRKKVVAAVRHSDDLAAFMNQVLGRLSDVAA